MPAWGIEPQVGNADAGTRRPQVRQRRPQVRQRRPQVSLRRPQVRVRSFLLAHHEVSSVGRTEVKATGAALRIHGAILSQLDA